MKIIKLNDAHVPYEDKRAIKKAFDACKEIQSDIIILDEWHDFYSISRFSKDPKRVLGLQDELNTVKRYLSKLRNLVTDDTRIIMLWSNHLERLRKYLWSAAPELSSLDCLKLESLLGLDGLNIEYTRIFIQNNILFKHGDICRKLSAYTARGELETERMSGCSGHTHRLGLHYKTKRDGPRWWMECGCLCDLRPEYMEGKVADWQHGYGLIEVAGNKSTPHPLAL